MWRGLWKRMWYMGVLRMIKFPDGELRDYLPATMKNDVDMVCLSYAIRKGTEQLMKYRKASMIYHFIDCVPEPILDLLAVELRSLYYSDTLPIETKRNIVKNTLRWHMQAGTPGAVAEMVKTVFGEGEVVEWPDFEEPPYTPGTFDIVTNTRLTPDILEYFASVIDRVKNVRSHLRIIKVSRMAEQEFFIGAGFFSYCRPAAVIDGGCIKRTTEQDVYAGAVHNAISCKPAAVIDGFKEAKEVMQETYTGATHNAIDKPAAVIDGFKENRQQAADIFSALAVINIHMQ